MRDTPYAILTPCFNEEGSIIQFLMKLDTALAQLPFSFIVVVIDDGSQDNSLSLLCDFRFTSSRIKLRILKLKFNVGHQMAIYQGLLYISKVETRNVIIMDSDGEDDPAAIPQVLPLADYDIAEIKRGKRSEKILFKMAYRVYKIIFWAITGKSMDYGNYCMISRTIVDRISYTGFIHLPAYLLKQKAKKTHIIFNRGKRIQGESKLGMKGLLMHAFKSFIEFGEDLLLLFLKLFFVICLFLLFIFIDLFYQKFIAKTAILGWFSTLAMEMIILAGMSLGFFILGILLLNLIHQQNNKDQQNIYLLIDANHESQPSTES
jgi:glycosyltransferase involved in cell wall biosynthesis